MPCCGAIQRGQLLAAMHYRCEIVLQEIGFFAGPETGQHQDRFAHASFAHVNAFIRAGDTEPIGDSLLKNSRDLRTAVAVAIALHD